MTHLKELTGVITKCTAFIFKGPSPTSPRVHEAPLLPPEQTRVTVRSSSVSVPPQSWSPSSTGR